MEIAIGVLALMVMALLWLMGRAKVLVDRMTIEITMLRTALNQAIRERDVAEEAVKLLKTRVGPQLVRPAAVADKLEERAINLEG